MAARSTGEDQKIAGQSAALLTDLLTRQRGTWETQRGTADGGQLRALVSETDGHAEDVVAGQGSGAGAQPGRVSEHRVDVAPAGIVGVQAGPMARRNRAAAMIAARRLWMSPWP